MQPTISRETVLIDIDRRQPILRWSAVFAGAACSVGFWMLLQLIGLGLGLTAVHSAASLRGAGIGTAVWSLISPLIAMFLGGLVAGRVAQTFDRKVAAAHGLVMWAITSVLGLCAMAWIVTMIAAGAARASGAAMDATGHMTSWTGDADVRAPTLRELGLDASDLLAPVNQRLAEQGKPAITVAQFESAVRGMVQSGVARGDFDQELLVDQLIAHTPLTRAEATEVERQIEARVDPLDTSAYHLEHRAERYVLSAVDASGKALATLGLSLLLSLVTSVLGAMVAFRRSSRSGEGQRGVRTTDPGYAPATAGMAGPASPVIPPTDVTSP